MMRTPGDEEFSSYSVVMSPTEPGQSRSGLHVDLSRTCPVFLRCLEKDVNLEDIRTIREL